MSESTPILPLLETVFSSILEVFLVCVVGWVLARNGTLDKKTQKQINRLNVSSLTPALLFSKVAFFLSPAKLRQLWIIPLFFCLVTFLSMVVAWILGRLFRLKRSQRAFAMAASMFMNSNSLPIALVQSLVVSMSGLKWGEHDTKNAMLGRALTYLVLYSTLGMVLRWSYGVKLLSQADDEVSPDGPASPVTERTPLLPDKSSNPSGVSIASRPSITYSAASEDESDADGSPLEAATRGHAKSSLSAKNPAIFYSFPNTPRYSTVTVASPNEHSDDEVSTIVPRRKRFLHRVWTKVNEFMTAPLWAAILSLVVACIPPLQHVLDTHVEPFKGALSALGSCSIPLTLIVLGGYFYEEKEDKGKSIPAAPVTRERSESTLVGSVRGMFKKFRDRRRDRMSRQEASRQGETKTVFVAIVSRMIITPLLLLPLFFVLAKLNSPRVFDDPVFIIANILLISSPPALTLAQITQAASGDAFERLISRTIFWSYCILTPITTILYVVVGMILTRV